MLDLSWNCSFRVQNVPELGVLNGKRVDVELRTSVVGKLTGGTARIEGMPIRLENPMRVREGGHIATEVQRCAPLSADLDLHAFLSSRWGPSAGAGGMGW